MLEDNSKDPVFSDALAYHFLLFMNQQTLPRVSLLNESGGRVTSPVNKSARKNSTFFMLSLNL